MLYGKAYVCALLKFTQNCAPLVQRDARSVDLCILWFNGVLLAKLQLFGEIFWS